MIYTVLLIIIAVIAYGCGSMSSVVIASNFVFHVNLRRLGTGSSALSNFRRIYGVKGFVKLLLAGDEKDCLLTVSDNGIGIPEGDMPRIFDRFYRVDKMRSRAAGGTGLGLSIAADTARRRGGSIAVSAREGGGTVFTVRLPRCKEGGDET